MHIVVAHSHLETFGGGERATMELLRRLAKRHDVTLWAGHFDPTATYAELGLFPRRDLATLDWLVLRPDADAVVAHTLGSNLLALRHQRTICYLHTMRSRYAQGGLRPDLFARRRLEYLALRRAHAVLTNSAYAAQRAERLYGLRPEVLPLGANEALFGVPEVVGEYALYVGRLAPEKGIERLLQWSAALPVDLALAGAGEPAYVEHLRQLAGPRTRFLGVLTGEALISAYATCRYFVFVPYAEEFGLAALDALATAKPVIAARDGGLIDLIRDGTTGYLVSTEEEFQTASRRLLADPALCARLGHQARHRARAYSWDLYARDIEALCTGEQRATDD